MLKRIHPLVLFRNQYFLFITALVSIILFNQVIIQYDLKRQNHDARLINIAGRQRMLGEKVVKDIVMFSKQLENGRQTEDSSFAIVKESLSTLNDIHHDLIRSSDASGTTHPGNANIDSLLQTCGGELNEFISAVNTFMQQRDIAGADAAIAQIDSVETRYLATMEAIVNAFQQNAEQKLDEVKRIELGLAAVSLIVIVLKMFFLFLPLIRRLKANNQILQENNEELTSLNHALNIKQREVQESLEQITALQNNLSESEMRYREIVEHASDMIYEVDEDGRFGYVNPVMRSITEYTDEELRSRFYHEIIHPDYADDVVTFYKDQRRRRVGYTYREFPIITKNNFEVWIGQNVTMTFTDNWVTKVQVVARDITVLYNANLALQANEELFRTLAQNAPVGIYQLDREGKITFVNKKWFEIVGLNASVEPRMHEMNIHEADRARSISLWSSAILNGHECSMELRYKHEEHQTWVSNKLTPLRNKEGSVIGYIGTMSDITLQKEMQREREESERRFRLLADNAPVGIFETSGDGLTSYVNKRYAEITGLGSDALGKGWVKAIHEDDRESVIREWLAAVREKREVAHRFRFRNAKNEIRWVTANALQNLGEDGKVIGYIGTISDITDLKEVQDKLASSERLYRLLSTNAKDLMMLHEGNDEATFTYVSPSSKDILGYEATDLIGLSPYSLVTEDHREIVKAFLNPHADGSVAEFRVKRKDGKVIWLECSSQPFHDEAGQPIGIQTSARDITIRKEFECSLHKAKVKAEEATLAKSNFLSMMSHEIRTPMNGIIGLTNLLIQSKPRRNQVEKLQLLKFSGDNLMRIINDILDFSKIEAGKVILEKADFNLRLLINNIEKTFEQRVSTEVALLINYGPNIPEMIKGDSVRIGQIINNLLSNAIKFTEKGYVDLTTTLLEDRGQECLIGFEIRDTGIGIGKDKINHIFESFSQGSVDTTRKYGGTGLGLSITRHLLDLMGSDISVESELGVGSKFSFAIRFEKASAIQSKESKPASTFGDNATVLLVEDNPINQLVAKNFLGLWGIHVDCADDGDSALKLVRSKSYRIILMDLQMPGMDGYETTRRIRNFNDDVYFQNIPIIALTASAMAETKSKVLAVGMNDFITKPFEPDVLKQKLEEYLKSPVLTG